MAEPERRGGAGLAVLVAIAWVASVVAANGFTSLLTGTDVVPTAAAGPLALPVGVVAAGAALAVRIATARPRQSWLALECAALVAVVLLVAGSAVVLVTAGAGAAFRYLVTSATGPYTVVTVVLAAIAGFVALLLIRAGDAGAGRPRWPWEGEDDEGDR